MITPYKPTFQRNIIQCLQCIADRNFQQFCIDNPRGPYIWIYNEFYDTLFEDSTLVETWKAGEWMFNKEVDQAIAELKPELLKIPYGLSNPVIIDMPQMQVLREKAAAILATMGQPPVSPYVLS